MGVGFGKSRRENGRPRGNWRDAGGNTRTRTCDHSSNSRALNGTRRVTKSRRECPDSVDYDNYTNTASLRSGLRRGRQ
jgi:hypothetical protein